MCSIDLTFNQLGIVVVDGGNKLPQSRVMIDGTTTRRLIIVSCVSAEFNADLCKCNFKTELKILIMDVCIV